MANNENAAPMRTPTPDPALRRLDKLMGTWHITGRTLGAQEDDIGGHTTIEWLPGGFYLQQCGEMEVKGVKLWSMEIIGYDPANDVFPAYVYSSMGGSPLLYHWDVQGNTVTHWTEGAKYTGAFSDDGTILSGGWRADGAEEHPGNTYDATMIRVDAE